MICFLSFAIWKLGFLSSLSRIELDISFKRADILVFEELGETARIEALSRDHEALHSSGVDRLLALLLEFESDLILNHLLDWLARHRSALFLNYSEVDVL